MDDAEKALLREIDRRPGARVLVTMDETEEAGKRLVKMGLARRDGCAFISIKGRIDD